LAEEGFVAGAAGPCGRAAAMRGRAAVQCRCGAARALLVAALCRSRRSGAPPPRILAAGSQVSRRFEISCTLLPIFFRRGRRASGTYQFVRSYVFKATRRG
jgi:hypothetical protein